LRLERGAKQAGIAGEFHIVQDGEEAIEYLLGLGKYADRIKFPCPSLIILDLKMPRKTGLEVLQWLQMHSELQIVPTIVLTASMIPEDIKEAYHLGANTYFVKPSSFANLVAMLKVVHDYWAQAQKP
jgi:CheY-like chemotaxis protein